VPYALHLALDQADHFFDDGLEYFSDLLCAHDQEAGIQSGVFVIGEAWQRYVHFCVLVFVEVALDKFFEVFQTHVPRLLLLLAHPVISLGADPLFHVVFEPVVEEC
jgi:hypothetical protein